MKANKTRQQRAIQQQQQHVKSSSFENLISKQNNTYTTPHSPGVAEGA